MVNCPLTVPRTIAPILPRYRSVTSSPSGLRWRIRVTTLARLTSSETNTYRKMTADAMVATRLPAAPCSTPSSHSPTRWDTVTTPPRSESGVTVMCRNGIRASTSLVSRSARSPSVLRSVLASQLLTSLTIEVICTMARKITMVTGTITISNADSSVTVADTALPKRRRTR